MRIQVTTSLAGPPGCPAGRWLGLVGGFELEDRLSVGDQDVQIDHGAHGHPGDRWVGRSGEGLAGHGLAGQVGHGMDC